MSNPATTPFTTAKLVPYVIGIVLAGLLGATLFSAFSNPVVDKGSVEPLQKNVLPDVQSVPMVDAREEPEQVLQKNILPSGNIVPADDYNDDELTVVEKEILELKQIIKEVQYEYEQNPSLELAAELERHKSQLPGLLTEAETGVPYHDDYEELMMAYHDNTDTHTDYPLEPRYQHLPIEQIDNELFSLEAKMDMLIDANEQNPSLDFEENIYPYVERFEALLQLRLQKASELEAQRVVENIANIKDVNIYNIPSVEDDAEPAGDQHLPQLYFEVHQS